MLDHLRRRWEAVVHSQKAELVPRPGITRVRTAKVTIAKIAICHMLINVALEIGLKRILLPRLECEHTAGNAELIGLIAVMDEPDIGGAATPHPHHRDRDAEHQRDARQQIEGNSSHG